MSGRSKRQKNAPTIITPKIQLRLAKAVEGGLTFPRALRFVFDLLRRYFPILKMPGAGVVVARHADVMTVLSHDAEFKPVYLPKIVETTGAFAVGLHVADPLYKRQIELMHSAVRREDPERIRRFIRATVEELIHCSSTEGEIDAVAGLSRLANARFVGNYFGVPGPDEATLDRWMHDIFRHIFANIANFRCIRDQAIASSKDMLGYVSELIQDRKQEVRAGTAEDNFLNRLLAQQAAGAEITDDEILGIVTGTFVGTVGISKAFGQGFDELLSREFEMYKAAEAARSGDIALVSKYVFEALRFNPQNPVMLRLSETGFTLGGKRIDAGSTIWAGTMSAMFDRAAVEAPNIFRTDRPDREYAHFGHGPHECFGKQMASIIIPEIAAALLRTRNLRRAEGSRGKLVYDGAFPQHLILKFDPN